MFMLSQSSHFSKLRQMFGTVGSETTKPGTMDKSRFGAEDEEMEMIEVVQI